MTQANDTHITPAPALHQVPLTSSGATGETFDLQVGQRLGAFELVRLLGKGGMGQVFLAEQLHPVQRQVALKFMQQRLTEPKALARFEIERQALARMSHPAIAQVFEAGATADGFPYLAMEYVPGEPIDRCCERLQLPLQARIELFVRVCLGVQHAHQRGIVHLDLKPGNVLVVDVDGTPQPKIIDFGLATTAGRGQKQRSSVLAGTRGYMSPEQVGLDLDGHGSDVDARSDVYGLGVMLYELVCGAQPFTLAELSSEDMLQLRLDYLRLSPRPVPEQLRSRGRGREARLAGGDLEAIVARSMALRRSSRYESVGELIEDLRAFLSHRPVRARRVSRWHRARLYVRRNRTPVTLAGLLLILLLSGLGAVTNSMLQAQRDRDLASARQQELERVVAFQKEMLSKADAATLGARLRSTLREQYAKAAPAADVAQFESDLALANPTEAARQLLGEELLGRGVATIERDLADQPVVAVELLQSIAESYAALGAYQRAVDTLANAKARWQAIGGDAHKVRRLELMSLVWRRPLGRWQELPTEIEALTAAARAAGDAEVMLRSQMLGAEIDGLGAGKLAHSIAAARALLPEFERVFGRSSDETILAMQALAQLLSRNGDFEGAFPVWQDLLTRMATTRSEDDLLRIGAIEQLSVNYARRGEPAKALELSEEVVRLRQRLQGNEHPSTLNAMSAKVIPLANLGRLPEAVAMSRTILDTRIRALGADHPDTLRSMLNLGAYYALSDDIASAADITRDSLARRLRTLGPDNPDTYVATHNLADYELILGNVEEALRLAETTHRERHRILGPTHPESQGSLPLLARALAAAGRCERAIPMLETERSDPERLKNSSTRAQSMAAHYLAGCYRKVGRAAEADALLSALGGILDAKYEELNPPQRHVLRQIRAAAK